MLLYSTAFHIEIHAANAALRTWTSSDGKTLQASLVSADKETAVLRLKGGRKYSLPLSKLSAADRSYIANLRSKGMTVNYGAMPEETSIPRQLQVEGGGQVFTTEHFEFHTDQKVTKAFIAEAARVYEGTYEAMSKLPLGIQMQLPKGLDKFRGIFMNQGAFNSEVAAIMKPSGPLSMPQGQIRVAGLYSTKRKELLVPYTSLGAKNSGSQKTLRKSSDTSTLIHEVVHQLMHNYLPIVPIWFSEGMSEYLNATPYQSGRFKFKNLDRGLKDHLEKKYREKPGAVIRMAQPEIILEQWTANWPGDMESYRDSMLLFYYFMHLDQKNKPGTPIAAFFNIIDQDNFNFDQFIADYQSAAKEFTAVRNEYNRQVKIYNESFPKFEKYVVEYNLRVSLLNKEIDNGIPKAQRTKLGAKPVPPMPPKELKVPDILKNNQGDTPNFVKVINDKAREILLRGRSYDGLATSLKNAYAEMGIPIVFKSAVRGAN